ncbi:MAG: hypothetical protein QOD99_1402 [Chthoniobacter sp.]|jgi:predicted outer membrane repeat protein|nr:hypothetical protein [Chthoniobacter sp.]
MTPSSSAVEILEARIAPATFTVMNPNDTGGGSLRDALALADADPATHDTIRFHLPVPPAHSENTIVLASELTSLGNVTIKGPGAGNLIIDGAFAIRIFHIDNGDTTTDAPASISGLSIVNGYQGTFGGGGIFSAESLTLRNVTISGCYAKNGTGGVGGGLQVDARAAGSFVKISHCMINDNFAQVAGGGLDLRAVKSIAVTSSLLANNAATNGGGGIFATLQSDAASAASITISGDTVIGNYGLIGGGIYATTGLAPASAKLTISSSKITGNNGTLGGGVFINGGTSIVTGSTIHDNSAKLEGGGIYADGPVSFTLSGSKVTGNRTTHAISSSDSNYSGGGVMISGVGANGTAKISGSQITENSAHGSGGGIHVEGGMSLLVTACTISGNNSADGGISPRDGGAGICADGTGANKVSLTITGSTISENQELDGSGFGGGIQVLGDSSLTMTASKVTGNQGHHGGGLDIDTTGAVKLTGDTITNNLAPGSLGFGGGVYLNNLTNASGFLITGGRIAGNSAQYGGGIFVENSPGTISSVITGNIATNIGGGVYQKGTGNVAIRAASVSGNTAPYDVSFPDNANFAGTFTFV